MGVKTVSSDMTRHDHSSQRVKATLSDNSGLRRNSSNGGGASSLSLFTVPPSPPILFDTQRVSLCPGGGRGLNPARAGEELATAHR